MSTLLNKMLGLARLLSRISLMLLPLLPCLAMAQTTTQNISISVGNGTLSYQYQVQQGSCGGTTQTSANQWQNFVYTPNGGSPVSLSGSLWYIYSCSYYQVNGGWGYESNSYSANGGSNEVTLTGGDYTITFSASIGDPYGSGSLAEASTVSGYINPKYVVVSVAYAPPGPSSYVDYTNSTLVGNTSSISSSFESGLSFSVSVASADGVSGWLDGKVTGTTTSDFIQSSSSSSSLTISKTASLSEKTPGPTNPYQGINHDYDVIWLWLNPVVLTTFTENGAGNVTAVQWNGYGYSALDPAGIDVVPIYVGQLNGDLPFTQDQQNLLARAWAASEMWPSGQGPALTSADYQTIEQADPYWMCTPNPSACPSSPSSSRFTQTNNNENVVYFQAPPGGQPITQTYTEGYTTTSTSSSGTSSTFKQTFALEESWEGSLFLAAVKESMTQSSTFSWQTTKNNAITNTNSSTATASITGPPCNVPQRGK